jgi:hypothetical protein
MASQLDTIKAQALALAETFEHVIPEFRAMGMSAALRRPVPTGVPSRELAAGWREALNDFLGMLSDLSGAQLRAFAAELRSRHGIELDSLQHRRLGRIAAVRERGRITSDAQFYLLRSRIDEISGFDAHKEECDQLQRLADAYELRHAKA